MTSPGNETINTIGVCIALPFHSMPHGPKDKNNVDEKDSNHILVWLQDNKQDKFDELIHQTYPGR